MSDIKRKVEDSKQGKLNPKAKLTPPNDGRVEVNWGNAEKIKILLLQSISNNLAELVKLMKDVKDGKE